MAASVRRNIVGPHSGFRFKNRDGTGGSGEGGGVRADTHTHRWAGSGSGRRAEGTVESGWGAEEGLCRNWGWWGGVARNVAEDMGLGGGGTTRVRMGRGNLVCD